MTASTLLRTATPDDLDGIYAIEREVFGVHAWSREMMRQELSADHRRYFILASATGTVLGYAGLLALGADGDIQTIAIHPSLRGTGQGRRLMHTMLQTASRLGVTRVFLEVRADNFIARSLYASLGFAQIAVRQHYYQPENIDAVVMSLELAEACT